MKIAGKIFKGLLNASLKINLDQDKLEELSAKLSIPDIKMPEYLNAVVGRLTNNHSWNYDQPHLLRRLRQHC